MKILLFIAIGVLVGLIFSYPEIEKLVVIYRIPIYRIGKLPASGQVQVICKADTKNTKSLLKRTNCCLWQIIVEEDQGRRRRRIKIYEEMSTEPFELVDETGRIQIFPAKAQLILHDDLNKENDSITPLPPRIDETIQSLGIQTKNVLGLQRLLRVHEQIVKPGDELFVLGEVVYENGDKVIKSGNRLPFIISDHRDYAVIGTLFRQIIGKVVTATIFVAVILSSIKPA